MVIYNMQNNIHSRYKHLRTGYALELAETEMKYAGWDKLESDNIGRVEAYKQVTQALEDYNEYADDLRDFLSEIQQMLSPFCSDNINFSISRNEIKDIQNRCSFARKIINKTTG